MEALVLLLGDFLFALFGGLFLLVAQLLGGLITFILELLFWFCPSSAGRAEAKPIEFKKTIRKRPLWLRVSQKVVVGLFILTAASAVVINHFFFEVTLRKIAGVVGRKTDIHLSFSEASGSFFSGHIELIQASVVRTGHQRSNFDIAIDRLKIELVVTQILKSPTMIELLEIESLSGSMELNRENTGGSSESRTSETIKPRRSFVIETLRLRDVALTIADNTNPDQLVAFPITVSMLEAIPLRSSYALFDLLFRANAEGSLAGQPFAISTSLQPNGRDTSWKIHDLPIELLSNYVGGIFKYIKTGVIDIEVDDQWRKARQTEIDTHWKLTLKGVTAEAPENLGRWTKTFADAAVKYINENGEILPLSLDFTMNEEEFKGAASLETVGLWNAFAEAFIKEISSQLKIETSDLKEAAKTGFNKFVHFLDEKRKKPDAADSNEE